MSKKLQVILLQNVKWYWNKWNLVEVSAAYAQNVLFRQWLAKLADSTSINNIKQAEDKKHRDHDKQLKHIYDLLEQIENNWWLKIEKQATAMNHLYDKIDSKEIAKFVVMNYHVKLPDSSFKMDKIETIWEFTINFQYEDIKKKIKVIVDKK